RTTHHYRKKRLLALFSHLQHSNHLKRLSNIAQSVVLDETKAYTLLNNACVGPKGELLKEASNLCRFDKIAPPILNSACAARRVRPKAELIPHDPPLQKKAPFGAFFASDVRKRSKPQ
ncbi:MAG: hypothetical protein ACTH5V_16405, partial [Serratia proteamaculans]